MESQGVLSEEEIRKLNMKIQKSHQSEKDWVEIQQLLDKKYLYALQPQDKSLEKEYCVEGMLVDQGALMAFTNPVSCSEYVKTHPIALAGGYLELGVVPFKTLVHIADDYQMSVRIDVVTGKNQKYLSYDGKTKTMHIYIIQSV